MTKTIPILTMSVMALIAFAIARADDQSDSKPAEAKEIKPAPERWAADGAGGTPGFVRHIQPIFGKTGCAGRACHGSFQGQGGFRLSLFGSDPKFDLEKLLTDKKDGEPRPRVDVETPENSLLLEKATAMQPHKGGKRFDEDSWQYRMIKDWIEGGAKFDPKSDATVERVEITPTASVLANKGDSAQLKIVAHFTDHTTENVTALTQFSTNDDAIATVSDAGAITVTGSGDTAIVATYGGVVSTSHVIVPFSTNEKATQFKFPANNPIDELAATKWRKLGLVPSPLADDAEFLRRVSLDLIGTLPTSDETRAFLDNDDPQKRAKKIDELLERPEYAMFWATKFCDLTGADERTLPQPRQLVIWAWYQWLKDKFDRNVPYDELAAGIITATSREGRSFDEYLDEYKKLKEKVDEFQEKKKSDFDFAFYAQRKTNDFFWRKGGNNGDAVAMQLSYAFLGIHLECAQCHKHPFDRWTQDDFKSWVAFFSPVKRAVPGDVDKSKLPEIDPKKNKNQQYAYAEVFVQVETKGRERGGKMVSPDSGKGIRPKALGGGEYPLKDGEDPRLGIMEWMRSPTNPFFARAIANRMWAHHFGVGIVDPADDLNAANPPSNPELLDWLAKDFIEHKFDLKHLHRTILNSRTYQLTWKPNDSNALDRRNFSHAQLRRLPAEVVVDAVNQVTGSEDRWGNLAPPGTRAIALAPSRIGANQGSGYALAIFGRPLRAQTCDCERSQDAGLPQALYLINDTDVNRKVSDKTGRVAKLVNEISDDRSVVEELYLSAVGRKPTDDETDKAIGYVAAASNRRAGFEDVAWSLLNLREFVFNH